MKKTYLSLAVIALTLAGSAITSKAATIYQSSGPGGTNLTLGAEFNYLQEVLVPNSRNPLLQTNINITRVTASITTEFNQTFNIGLIYSNSTSNVQGTPPSGLFFPATAANVNASSGLVVFGNGVDTLFTVTPRYDVVPGFGQFWVGIKGGGVNEVFWNGASGPDFDNNRMYGYDYFTSASGLSTGSQYLIVEGTPAGASTVPEPATLGLFSAGLLSIGVSHIIRRERAARKA